MTALRRLSPLVLLLLAACRMSATNAPKGTQGHVQATEAAQVVSAAKLGGSVVIQATQEPTALPTADVEKAKMLADMQAMNAQLEAQRKQLDDKAAEIAASQAKAAEANAQTAKQDALTEAEKTKQQEQITAQMQLEKERLLALAQYAEAQARKSEADAKSLLAVAVTMLAVIAGLLLMRILARYSVLKIHGVAEETVHPESVTRPPVQVSPTGISTRPLPVEPELMARFIKHAIIPGNLLGAGNIEAAHILKSTERDERSKIIVYLDKLGHIDHKGGLSLTGDAISYWAGWLALYASTALPQTEIMPESAAFTRHDAVTHEHDASGGNGGDPFNITPQPDNFSAARTNYEPQGIMMPDKDGEK